MIILLAMPFCTVCDIHLDKKKWIGHLKSLSHKNRCTVPVVDAAADDAEIIEVTSAFRKRIASYRILPTDDTNHIFPDLFLNTLRSKVNKLLNSYLKKHTSLKVNFEYYANFLLFKNDQQEIKSFATKNFEIHNNFNFEKIFELLLTIIKKKLEEFQDRDSGWSFLNNLYLEVNINKYDPLNGSTYTDLPAIIKNKKACVNIKNKDAYCFFWSIVAALFPVKRNAQRLSSYPFFGDVLNIKDVTIPVSFLDIKTFESNNQHISINVYSLKKNKTVVGPIYRSEYHNRKNKINLLLLENGNVSHYVLIRDLPRLVRSQISKHHGKLYFCEDCLIFFSSEITLSKHICSGVMTVIPEKGTLLEFKNFSRKQDVPFVIYADFETILKPIQGCEPDASSCYTVNRQQHVPAAFAYQIVCSYNKNLNRFVQYRGKDCVKKFIKYIYSDVRKIYEILDSEIPMIFTEKDAESYSRANTCHICGHLLFFDKVRDHDHLDGGKYRGAAHNFCNLKFSIPKLVPVFFHNLAGYDCHLFIKELGESQGPIKIIPKNKENYISFTKFLKVTDNKFVQLRFVDSFKFLGTSLDKLCKGLNKTDFIYVKDYFQDDREFQLMIRKGVYPYDYMKDWKSYSEETLPPKDSFFNSLTDEHITDKDYDHAKQVWDTFTLKNLGEYTDLYLKNDVLLLTDIFENFRKVCKINYELDPAFYLTAPSLSFDAMLLKTGVQLELLSDLEIIRLIQKGIRGGICLCSARHAQANNKYMTNFDTSIPESFLIYIDCNNLYGYSMCQWLPVSDFKLLNVSEIKLLDIMNIPDDAEYGYILEVDLVYPEKLHCIHNDYPLCAEKFIPPGGKTTKLIPNLYSKYEYVIHYVHLKTCLRNGIILGKIHRVITFRQSQFLADYINLNTELRKAAKTAFQQDLFKLLNNSVFGKTLEDSENRVDVKLINQWDDTMNKTKKHLSASKLIARPNFHSASVFSENLVAIQMNPERVILDKPIYIGFAVLELSKSHMYEFHYSVIKPYYKNSVQLCYTDTDSFIYKIETSDFYEDLKQNFLEYFDTSNYKPNNVFDIPIINKKIPGLFKDELGGEIMLEFVGLRSKLYCIKTASAVIKKAKGVKRSVIKKLCLNDYTKALIEDKIVRRKNLLFKSIKHEIFTQSVNKIALSNADDKRFIKRDKITTLSWGHKSIH